MMYEYFCIGFIGFMLKGKNLLDYTNLFSFYQYEKKDKIMLDKKIYCVIFGKYRRFKKHFCSKSENKDEKIFKEEETIEKLKIYNHFKNTVKKPKSKT